jgi:hypothetical protein
VQRRAVLLLGTVVFALAGCGGGGPKPLTKAQYERHLQADGAAAQRATRSLGTNTRPLALAKNLAQIQATLRRIADDLDGLRPPSDAVRDNARIAAGLRGLAASFEPLRRKLAAGKKVDLAQEFAQLNQPKSVADAQRAINDLQRKGYTVGVFGT